MTRKQSAKRKGLGFFSLILVLMLVYAFIADFLATQIMIMFNLEPDYFTHTLIGAIFTIVVFYGLFSQRSRIIG